MTCPFDLPAILAVAIHHRFSLSVVGSLKTTRAPGGHTSFPR